MARWPSCGPVGRASGPHSRRDRRRCLWLDELQDLTGADQAEAFLEDLPVDLPQDRGHAEGVALQSPLLKKDHALKVLAAIRQVATNPTKYSRLA